MLIFDTHSFSLCYVTLGLNLSHSFNESKNQQNKSLRFILKTPIKSKITPQYLKSEILKLDDLYHFEMAKLMYQFVFHKVLF